MYPLPADRPGPLPLPLALHPAVPAGYPSPAQDYEQASLDLTTHLIRRPAATFLIRVSGWSMIGAGIHDGDLAVVDRSVTPQSGAVVVAILNGELTLKRLRRQSGRIWLEPDPVGGDYPVLHPAEGESFEIWGVVTYSIRQHG